MQINHLINGKQVRGSDYFETVNPATQEVLAEVASGGEPEVNAAVAAAKEAFPKWAAMPAPQRAKIIRKLGDLIAAHVPELAQTETNDTGQVIAQTGKQLVPRAADNFYYFAEMCTRVDGHTYPTDTHLNYTLFHPVGVCHITRHLGIGTFDHAGPQAEIALFKSDFFGAAGSFEKPFTLVNDQQARVAVFVCKGCTVGGYRGVNFLRKRANAGHCQAACQRRVGDSFH